MKKYSHCTTGLRRLSGVIACEQAVAAPQCWWSCGGSSLGRRAVWQVHVVYSAICLGAQNWGGSVAPARLGKLLVPRTTGEVAAAVAAAAAAGRRVRAIGKGHTWTPMFFDADGVWGTCDFSSATEQKRSSMPYSADSRTLPCPRLCHAGGMHIVDLQRPCAQNTDVIFTTLLKLPSGERIEMAGCGPAPLLLHAGIV